jgi:hypothetical protein
MIKHVLVSLKQFKNLEIDFSKEVRTGRSCMLQPKRIGLRRFDQIRRLDMKSKSCMPLQVLAMAITKRKAQKVN